MWHTFRQNKAIISITLLFLLLGGFYSWLTPPFEGPDEAQHFAYITWLAEGNGFPPQDRAWETPLEQEAGQPPFYYLLASLPARLVDTTNPTAVYRPNPHFIAPAPRMQPDNDNRAITYPSDGRPLRGGWLAFYLARALTLLSGTVLIVAIYGLVQTLLPQAPQLALAAAFLTAVTPQFLFISGVVSNDVPSAALSALTSWQMVRLLRFGATPRRALGIGLTLGLAGLTKISGLTLGLPLLLGLLWLWRYRQEPFWSLAQTAVWLGLGTAATSGWWLVRVWYLYGSPLGLETHDQAPWAINDPEKLAGFVPRWQEVFRSYWAAFGWGTIRPPGWVYTLLALLCLTAVCGLLLAGYRWWQQPNRSRSLTAVVTLLLGSTLIVVCLFLEIWMRRVIAPYGRLLYPALATITLALVLGWYTLHRHLLTAALALVLLLALILPFTELMPAYPPYQPRYSPPDAPPIGALFGPSAADPIAELLSVTPAHASAVVGSGLPVTTCWRPLRQSEQDYTIFIHLVGRNNQIGGGRRTFPGLGQYPTSQWQPDRPFCDTIQVPVAKELAQTMRYQVEVGLIDEETNVRVSTFSPAGEPFGANFFAAVRLEAANPLIITPAADASPIQLVDVVLAERTWQPGSSYPLTLSWSLAEPVTADYQLYVHLRPLGTETVAAQADGPPLDGWYPTSWWRVGEVVTDARQFNLPADVPPGQYELVVGFYQLQSGERLGQPFKLAQIEVGAAP